jgi:hypothetical protein
MTFQKDAVLGDHQQARNNSTGASWRTALDLGKTFTALAVIKYYENRNTVRSRSLPQESCQDNWNTYKDNYVNNPIALDRLRL